MPLNTNGYSVLMSVYAGEKPEHLQAAIDSMLDQSLPTDDFILVCDGPLTDALDTVIAAYPQLRVVRLPRHEGISAALNEGLLHCRHEFVARMDSDDVSLPQRCRDQLQYLLTHPDIAILSGTVVEFDHDPALVTGQRTLPEDHARICRFSRKRNPFNHPAVMFRKSAVIAAGGYFGNYPLFEDYDLWIRMLCAGFRGKNLREPVLYMRAGNTLYHRRSGGTYAENLLAFHRQLRLQGWSTEMDYLSGGVPHAIVCWMPVACVRRVYARLHR